MSTGGGPRAPQQQRRALDRADHALGDVGAERAAAEHHVLQDLDEDAAEAEHRDRAEHRVAVDAQDALHAALQLLRHQHAFDRARPARRVLARSSSRSKPSRTAAASATSSSTPPISDLCRMSGDRIFITTGKPKRSAAATASSALAQACSRGGRDAGRRQQPLCLRLGGRACPASVTPEAPAAGAGGGAAKASPKRPIASIATTARVGSSWQTQPSASSSPRPFRRRDAPTAHKAGPGCEPAPRRAVRASAASGATTRPW